MTLPAGQQHVLDRIESDLEDGEPRLRSMFAIFTRLTRDEGAPRTESLPRQGRRRWIAPDHGPRVIIAVPLVLIVVTLFVFMAISSSATLSCRPAAGAHTATIHTLGCQSALQGHGRG